MLDNIGSKIVEPILDGLFGYFNNWVLSIVSGILNFFADDFGPSMSAWRLYIGSSNMESIQATLTFAGIGIATSIFIFHIFMNPMQRLTGNKEELLSLFYHYAVALILVSSAAAFFEESILSTAEMIYESIMSIKVEHNFYDQLVEMLNRSAQDIIQDEGNTILTALIGVIFGITIIINFFKFALGIIEKYVTMCVMVIFFPVAASTYASKSTSSIFSSYIKMLLGQLALLIMNAVFTVGLYGMIASGYAFTQGIIGMSFVIGYLRIAQRADVLLRSSGMLNTAQQFGSIMDSCTASVMQMSMLARTGRGAVGMAGNAMQAVGIKSGSYSKFMAGQNLKNVSQGRPSTDSQNINQYMERGGKMSAKDPSAMEAASRSAMTSGYRDLANMPQDVQQGVVEKNLGASTAAAAGNAGYDNASLKDVSVGANGDIFANMAYGDGREMAVKMTKTPPSDPTSAIGKVQDMAGNEMYLSKAMGANETMAKARHDRNLNASNPDVMDAARSMMAHNGAGSLKNMPHDVQEGAFKEAHAAGFNGMATASGLGVSANDIKGVSIDGSGNIRGTTNVAGREMDISISPTPPKDNSTLIGSYTDANGKEQYVSATPHDNLPVGSDIEYSGSSQFMGGDSSPTEPADTDTAAVGDATSVVGMDGGTPAPSSFESDATASPDGGSAPSGVGYSGAGVSANMDDIAPIESSLPGETGKPAVGEGSDIVIGTTGASPASTQSGTGAIGYDATTGAAHSIEDNASAAQEVNGVTAGTEGQAAPVLNSDAHNPSMSNDTEGRTQPSAVAIGFDPSGSEKVAASDDTGAVRSNDGFTPRGEAKAATPSVADLRGAKTGEARGSANVGAVGAAPSTNAGRSMEAVQSNDSKPVKDLNAKAASVDISQASPEAVSVGGSSGNTRVAEGAVGASARHVVEQGSTPESSAKDNGVVGKEAASGPSLSAGAHGVEASISANNVGSVAKSGASQEPSVSASPNKKDPAGTVEDSRSPIGNVTDAQSSGAVGGVDGKVTPVQGAKDAHSPTLSNSGMQLNGASNAGIGETNENAGIADGNKSGSNVETASGIGAENVHGEHAAGTAIGSAQAFESASTGIADESAVAKEGVHSEQQPILDSALPITNESDIEATPVGGYDEVPNSNHYEVGGDESYASNASAVPEQHASSPMAGGDYVHGEQDTGASEVTSTPTDTDNGIALNGSNASSLVDGYESSTEPGGYSPSGGEAISGENTEEESAPTQNDSSVDEGIDAGVGEGRSASSNYNIPAVQGYDENEVLIGNEAAPNDSIDSSHGGYDDEILIGADMDGFEGVQTSAGDGDNSYSDLPHNNVPLEPEHQEHGGTPSGVSGATDYSSTSETTKVTDASVNQPVNNALQGTASSQPTAAAGAANTRGNAPQGTPGIAPGVQSANAQPVTSAGGMQKQREEKAVNSEKASTQKTRNTATGTSTPVSSNNAYTRAGQRNASEIASGVTLDPRWKAANARSLEGSRFTPSSTGGMELRSYQNEVMMYQDVKGTQHYSTGTKTVNEADFSANGTYETAGYRNVKILGRNPDGSFTMEADGFDKSGNPGRKKYLCRDYAKNHDEKGRVVKGNRTHKSLLISEVSDRKKDVRGGKAGI